MQCIVGRAEGVVQCIIFPRRSLLVVLQATVGSGGEDLGMRLLLCEMYASGKR